MSRGTRPRVLIGDDHSLVAEGLKQLLEPEFDVVGISNDGRDLLDAAERLRPDVALIDVGMPRLNGLDAARRILASVPGTKVIHLTMNSDPEIQREALSFGASAFLQKTVGRRTLADAIHKACNVPEKLAHRCPKSDSTERISTPIELSDRQRDVLQLLAEGYSMKQVGGMLNLATRTVAFHKYRIMDMLGLANYAELIQFALKKHLLFLNRGHQVEDACDASVSRDRDQHSKNESRRAQAA